MDEQGRGKKSVPERRDSLVPSHLFLNIFHGLHVAGRNRFRLAMVVGRGGFGGWFARLAGHDSEEAEKLDENSNAAWWYLHGRG